MLKHILPFLLMLLIIKGIYTYLKNLNKSSDKIIDQENNNFIIYTKKRLLTDTELNFFNILNNLSDKYAIIPQVCLASVIQKKSNLKYSSELYRI